MDVATKIQIKLKKILKKLKGLGIIKTFKLEINFFPIKRNLIKSLIEIDSVLKKSLRKIIIKPRRAEIRNIITELVRKKNSNEVIEEKAIDKNIYFTKYTNRNLDIAACNFHCGICDETFCSKKNFVSHRKNHKKPEINLCEKCGRIFQTTKKWQEHLKNHNEENTLYLFTNYLKSSQRNHKVPKEESSDISLENLKRQLTKTQLSSESFHTTENELKNLVQNMNVENQKAKSTEEKTFACTCGKVFRFLKSLKKHVKLKHSFNVTKFHCPNCKKCFREKGKLNRHMLSHKGSQYCCSVCSKLFARSDTLKRHFSACHCISKGFCCSFCQKKFNLKYNRDIHEENIHKNFNHWIQCEHCGKKFKNKLTFRSHLKIHLNKEITCKLCGKSFVRKVYYENHMKRKHISHQKPSSGVSL